MESAPAEHAAANSRAKTLRTTKSGLAKRYQVGIRTIENWQYSGVIYARFEQGRAVFDAADRSVGCGLYEPQRPGSASAGIFVGTLPPNQISACREALILLGFEALGEDAADAKGDFHDAQIDGKHSENHLNSRHFLKAVKSRQTLKTMATVLNHTVCGGSCGDERRTLWPA